MKSFVVVVVIVLATGGMSAADQSSDASPAEIANRFSGLPSGGTDVTEVRINTGGPTLGYSRSSTISKRVWSLSMRMDTRIS
jgi:hypothetical protein